jgi:hypothetical protein
MVMRSAGEQLVQYSGVTRPLHRHNSKADIQGGDTRYPTGNALPKETALHLRNYNNTKPDNFYFRMDQYARELLRLRPCGDDRNL